MQFARLGHERRGRCGEHSGLAAVDRIAGISASFDTHSMVADRSRTREEEYPSSDEYARDCPVARGRATARAALGHWDRKVLVELDVDVRQNHAWEEIPLSSPDQA